MLGSEYILMDKTFLVSASLSLDFSNQIKTVEIVIRTVKKMI